MTLSNISGIATGVSWILGYRVLADALGWPSLQERFSAVGYGVLASSGALAGVLVLILSAVSAWLKGTIANPAGVQPGGYLGTTLTQSVLQSVLNIIVAPAAEELMFRGLLLDWLMRRLTAVPAIAILSLLFSLIHVRYWSATPVDWLGLTYIFAMGVLASLLTIKYKSLQPAFVLHVCNNLIAAFVGDVG